MARNITIGGFGDYCSEQMEKLLRAAVLETDSRLKAGSPVDTGRFRASWQVGENAAPGGELPEGQYGSTPPLTRIGYQRETLGNVYSVHNNLPYAEPLADGHSKQAPAGWVQLVAKDVQGFVTRTADQIGRQS